LLRVGGNPVLALRQFRMNSPESSEDGLWVKLPRQ
jgi:hypothetical protein